MKKEILVLFEELEKANQNSQENILLLNKLKKIVEREIIIFEFRINKQGKSINITQNYLNASLEELEETNQELKKHIDSNIKLENFAYVASHDLKTPLRTILNFASLLKERKIDQLDQEGQLFVDFIYDASQSLDSLINDMLAYSVAGTSGQMIAVNTQILVADCLNAIQLEIKEKNAQIKVHELPVIYGYKAEIFSLFQDFISNALKYCKPDVPPEIEINCAMEEDHWVFSVADNGLGFDVSLASKVFTMFQRLENASEQEGTGIGLALCKKIVELHQGKIWVESEEGVGSTFFFRLPKSLEKL